MDEKELNYSNFMPEEFQKSSAFLRGEKGHWYKIIQKRNYFSLITKFLAKNGESTPLKNNSSIQRASNNQDKKEVLPMTSCIIVIKGKSVEGTNLQMLLDCWQVHIRIRNFKVLPMSG